MEDNSLCYKQQVNMTKIAPLQLHILPAPSQTLPQITRQYKNKTLGGKPIIHDMIGSARRLGLTTKGHFFLSPVFCIVPRLKRKR